MTNLRDIARPVTIGVIALIVEYLLLGTQQFANAMTLGAIYALIALGYTMVYGIVELINFAHGDIFMVGAFLAMWIMTTIFGLTAAQAKKVGSDWVSWKVGTSQFANLKADVTFAAVTALLPKAKGTRLSTGIANGANVYVLKWTVAASSSTPMLSNTLTVSAGGQSLPVEQISTAAGGTKATTLLSGWGELVPASAPPAASTIASPKITH